jgi:transcriptional regulator GlxA family with amidase domain
MNARTLGVHVIDSSQTCDDVRSGMAQTIGFYICPEHEMLDLAGPLGAFEAAARIAGQPLYDLAVTSRLGGHVVGSAGVPIGTLIASEVRADTLIVVGGEIERMVEPATVEAMLPLAANATRLVSVCTGAFMLAEGGLLDGRRATTHYQAIRALQRGYPAVKVETDRIFVADGNIWTSAGITAGIDLALALIETDHGIELSREVARQLVVYHRRPGGLSQFSAMAEMEPHSERIRLSLTFARKRLGESLPVERLAAAANLSVRQFGRAFRLETGETPAKAIERLRVEAARIHLINGSEPIERIAKAVGFSDPDRMRRAFLKIFGQSPQAVRSTNRRNP